MGLDLHTLLRPHKDPPPVNMGSEGHALFLNMSQRSERKDLKPAAVGQNRAFPPGEAVQPTHAADHLISGPKMQMVGIAQHDLALQRLQVIGGNPALDGSRGRDIHKGRCLHRTVYGGKFPASGSALLSFQLIHSHPFILLRRAASR